MVLEKTISAICLAVVLGAATVTLIRQICVYRWGKCKSKRSLEGKTVIITGATSDIGKATAKELVDRGARIILACWDLDLALVAEKEIRNYTQNGEIAIKLLDLGSLASVRQFADDVLKTEERLDILINNASVFCSPKQLTDDGFEMHMGINHLGHFLLTTLLIDKLKSCRPSRIIVIVSSLYNRGKLDFNDLNKEDGLTVNNCYYNSKLANAIFAVELSRRLENTGVSVYAASPGIVWTGLGHNLKLPWYKMIFLLPSALFYLRTPQQGCQTIVHCAISDNLGDSGSYYKDCKLNKFSPCATDKEAGRALWAASEQLVRPIKHTKDAMQSPEIDVVVSFH